MSIAVYVALCPACIHGGQPWPCDSPAIVESAGGGVTCSRYAPKAQPKAAVPVAHLMALPDREPCTDCACRKGTLPNGTHHSMADFAASVERREPFLCHDDGKDRICAGWLRAAKARHGKDGPA